MITFCMRRGHSSRDTAFPDRLQPRRQVHLDDAVETVAWSERGDLACGTWSGVLRVVPWSAAYFEGPEDAGPEDARPAADFAATAEMSPQAVRARGLK